MEKRKEEQLSYRHELKYYINYKDYIVLRSALSHVMRHDSNTGKKGYYDIRSLYFDDLENTALVEKMAGTDHRAKYRVRIYDYSDRIIRFEKKIKEGQFIAKKSIKLTKQDLGRSFRANMISFSTEKNPLPVSFISSLAQSSSGQRSLSIIKESLSSSPMKTSALPLIWI